CYPREARLGRAVDLVPPVYTTSDGCRFRSHRIGPYDYRIHDRDHLGKRQIGLDAVSPDRLFVDALIDADRSDAAHALLEHVAADPTDFVGHLLVGDLQGTFRRDPELFGGLPA